MGVIPNTNVPGLVLTSTGMQNDSAWGGGGGAGNSYTRELSASIGVSGIGITSQHNISSCAALPNSIDQNTGNRQDLGTITSEPIPYGAGDVVAAAGARWDGLTPPYVAGNVEVNLFVSNPGGTEYLRIQASALVTGPTVVVGYADFAAGPHYRIGSDLTYSGSLVTTTAGGVYVVSMVWSLQW